MKLIFLLIIAVCLNVNTSEAQDPSTETAPPTQQSEMSDPRSTDQPEPKVKADDKPVGYFNVKTKTFGGQQFWTDVRYVGGWRIQNNSETKHFRLIDARNVRHAWGNQLHCNQVLNQAIDEGKAKRCSGRMVIILHGLIRTSKSMRQLGDHLESKGKYTTINFEYASTRKKVDEHAIALKSVIENLGPDVTEINLVGHSLGNLVVRRYLGDTTDPTTGKQGDPRIKRAVMIGPPNQGSRMARLLKSSKLFLTLAGVSGAQLSRSWDQLEPTLATPKFEFGIIAGGQESDEKISNFVLKGKDDFTVSVEETKLDGASDFLIRPLFHSTMMNQPDVINSTLCFLENGYFVSEDARCPLIEKDIAPTETADRSDR